MTMTNRNDRIEPEFANVKNLFLLKDDQMKAITLLTTCLIVTMGTWLYAANEAPVPGRDLSADLEADVVEYSCSGQATIGQLKTSLVL